MDLEEIRSRIAVTAQREAARLRYAVRRPEWRRSALAKLLSPGSSLLLTSAQTELGHQRWGTAHRLLMQHFASRPARFVLDPLRRPATVSAIRSAFADAPENAAAKADRIVGGRFDLLGYRDLVFSGEPGRAGIDWELDPVHQRRSPRVFWSRVPYLEPSIGDHKIVWELNRHQYWLALGRAYWLTRDRRYRRTFVEHFDSWMKGNPPLRGTNWASMLELGLRTLSWLWALHFFAQDDSGQLREGEADSAPWTVDLLIALDRQLTLVQRNLSRYFSPNTHLLGEALALYAAGRSLPELRNAAAWERAGRTVLLEQIGRQIHADGGHAELSAHYHRYTLDFYLLALAIARRTGDSAAGEFAAAARSLARFARTLADDNGRLPMLGDDDGGSMLPLCGREPVDAGDSLQIAAALLDEPALAVGPPAEEVVWMTGEAPRRATAAPASPTPWTSAALPDTGYIVCRTARGDHLTVDAGPHGFLNGGHAHADALAVTLTVRGVPFLIDPGTGCYTVDPAVRDRFRSTGLHNTVTIDGRSQSIPAGPFHWQTRAHGTILDWRTTARFDYFEGVHDGYAPIVHQRVVLARPGCWVVLDRVFDRDAGDGPHRADAHWHLAPAWLATRPRPGTVRVDHSHAGPLWILALDDDADIVRGEPGSELGWCAPVYGGVVATSTVRITRRAVAPFRIVTVILDSAEEPTLERVPVATGGTDGPPHEAPEAFVVRTRSWSETFLFPHSRGTAGSAPAIAGVGPIHTDARVLCWREDEREQTSEAVVLIDGTFAERRRDVGADAQMAGAAIGRD